MSSQGSISGADDQAFGLIETFRWSLESGYDYLDEHMARLERSAQLFDFAFRPDLVARRLAAFAADLTEPSARVRLVHSRSGSLEISSSSLGAAPTSYRVAIARSRHRASDPWLLHKTTMRDRYERPLAAAADALRADEVLFLNEDGALCEGARTNIFVKRGELLLTPPLTCGVLPGTLRAHLIGAGKARETTLRLADLVEAEQWFVGNSVRGLVPGLLVETGT